MATVGRIVVDVDADTAKFVKGLQKSTRRTEQWSTKIKREAVRAVKGFSAAAVAAGVALAAFTVRGVQAGDQLAKTAQKLGLTAEALSSLRFAAQQTGVETRKLDLGIQRMTRRISEAAQGTGEAQGAIKELGLDARELSRLTIDQQFLQISDAMEDVKNQSDRVRLGFKLFDSEGVALINTLGAGREELEKFFERSKELGTHLDRNQTRVVQEANDAIGEMKTAFSGLSLQLGASFGPAIEAAAGFITNFTTSITQSLPSLVNWLENITGIRREIEDLAMKELGLRATDLQRQLNDQLALQRGAQEAIDIFNDPADIRGEGIDIRRERENLGNARAAAARLRRELGEVSEQVRALRRDETEANIVTADSYDTLTTAISGTKEVVSQFQRSLPSTGAPIFDVEPGLDEIAAMTNLERRMLGIGNSGSQAVEQITDALEDTKDATEDVNERFRGFGRVITNQLDFAIDRGMKFRDLLSDLARDLASFAIRSAILGGLGNIAPKLFGVPGFATGGSFTVGGSGGTDSQLVAFRATPGERVDVRTPSQSRTAGVTVNNFNNIDARGADAGVVERMAGALERVKEETKAEVFHVLERGLN